MNSGPSLEPTMRADRTLDAALVTVVIALFVAAGFGLNELPGGASEWAPKEWKGVHDCAKGLLLPLLAARFGLALLGSAVDATMRNRVWTAMGLCWVGDIALTFSGEQAFLIGLVSFLLGHVMFIATFRHLFKSGWAVQRGWIQARGSGLNHRASCRCGDQFVGSCGGDGSCDRRLRRGDHHHGLVELDHGPWSRCLDLALGHDSICRQRHDFGFRKVWRGAHCPWALLGHGDLYRCPMGLDGWLYRSGFAPSNQPSVRTSPTARIRCMGWAAAGIPSIPNARPVRN